MKAEKRKETKTKLYPTLFNTSSTVSLPYHMSIFESESSNTQKFKNGFASDITNINQLYHLSIKNVGFLDPENTKQNMWQNFIFYKKKSLDHKALYMRKIIFWYIFSLSH